MLGGVKARRHKNYESIGTAHIGTLLAEAIRDPRRVREALGVWPAWEEAVGPQIAAATRPVSMRDGVLTVHVKHAVWLQELHQMRQGLLRRVRRVAAGGVVRDLRFKVGKLPLPSELSPPSKRPPIPVAPIPYEVARAIRGVQSPGLRGAMIRVAARWAGLLRQREGG